MNSPDRLIHRIGRADVAPATRAPAMRIGYVTADRGVPVFGRKGASIHVQAMASAFDAVGHEVEILTTRVGDSSCKLEARVVEVTAGGSPSGEANARGRRNRHRRLAIERRCLALGESMYRAILDRHLESPFDFLYERYSLWSAAGVRAASELGIPCVVEINAPLVLEQKTFRELVLEDDAHRLEREVFAGADVLIAVSEAIKSYAVSKGASESRTVVVPNGVDIERFGPEVPPAPFELARDRFVVGFVGSLKSWHDIGTLLDAIRILVREAPDYHLLIVGDGPLRPWIEGYVRGAHLESQVTIAGWMEHEEMPAFVNLFDVAVAPYARMTNFYFSPLKLYEYLAAGRAVVASAVGQIGELIADGETGLLVAPGDPTELAAKIRRLRRDDGYRQSLGRAAREVARTHTWIRNAERIVALAAPSRKAI